MVNNMKQVKQSDEELDKFVSNYRSEDNITDACCICYENVDMLQKIQLPCNHLFCLSCLQSYHLKQHLHLLPFTCPLCRKDIGNNIYQYIYSNAARFVSRAYRSKEVSEMLQHFVKMARNEIVRMMTLVEGCSAELKCQYNSKYMLMN
jgi:hypothetical protein